jgi:hypothetical protein
MTGTVLFLAGGASLLIALFLFIRYAGSPSTKVKCVTEAQEVLNALQAELLPNWFVDRLFSKEDWEFARRQDAPAIPSLFDNERKAVALSWLRHTQDYVAQLMDFHVRLARQRPDLKPSTEVKLTLEYIQFQLLCRFLAGLIRMVGPVRVRSLAGHAVNIAAHLGEASEKALASLDDAVPVNAE